MDSWYPAGSSNGHIPLSPLISIGLPVFNGSRYLRQSIQSLLAQNFRDFEILIADNASTDGSWEIACQFAEQDERIRVHRHDRNHGAFYNFIYVLRNTASPYFMWHAHDDVLKQGYIEACLEYLKCHPDYVLCGTQNVFIDETGGSLEVDAMDYNWDAPDPVIRYRKCLMNLAWPTIFYGLVRSNVIKRIDMSKCTVGLDWLILAELSLYGKVHQIPQVLRATRMRKPGLRSTLLQSTTYVTHGPHTRPEWFPWIAHCTSLIKRVLKHRLGISTTARILITTLLYFGWRPKLRHSFAHLRALLLASIRSDMA